MTLPAASSGRGRAAASPPGARSAAGPAPRRSTTRCRWTTRPCRTRRRDRWRPLRTAARSGSRGAAGSPAVAAAICGSRRRSQAHLEAVNEATGTTPIRDAQTPGPPNASTRPTASEAERVSFQSIAGRSGRPARPGRPGRAAGPPTEMAAISAARPVWASAARSASHQTSGWVSRAPPVPVTVCCGAADGDDVRRCRRRSTMTLVDCVEQSTPATSVLPLIARPRPLPEKLDNVKPSGRP